MSPMDRLLSRRFFVVGTLLGAATLGAFQLSFLDSAALVISYHQEDATGCTTTPTHPHMDTPAVIQNESAQWIVSRAFNSSFAYLHTNCGEHQDFRQCCLKASQQTHSPWWVQTMMRDVPKQHVLSGWHKQSAANATSTGDSVRMCAIEKVGIKHWKQLFCVLQNRTERLGGYACLPNETVADEDSSPKIVFLRDPLERFLSAFINKCIVKGNEEHCEPVLEYVKGMDKQSLFEAYVNTFPLQWNVHFFPQSLYCDGLYRNLHTYDFIGRMGPNFYQDLERLGNQFGGKLQDGLEQVFSVSKRLTSKNQGIETSASSHVLEYYTPKTVRQVLEYMAIDYALLDLPIPEWAERMLSES